MRTTRYEAATTLIQRAQAQSLADALYKHPQASALNVLPPSHQSAIAATWVSDGGA